MNVMKRMTGWALLGCLASGMLAGCGDKKTEPAPGKSEAGKTVQAVKSNPLLAAVPAVKKVDLPAPQPVDNANVIGMGRVHNPDGLVDRLGAWAALFVPNLSGDSLRAQMAMFQIDLKQIKPADNLGVFILAPPAGSSTPAGTVILPVPTSSSLVKALSGMMGNIRVTPIGSSNTMLTPISGEGTTSTVQMGPELVRLNQAPSTSDLQIYMNAGAVMAQYGSKMQERLQSLSSTSSPVLMAAAQGDSTRTAQVQAVLRAEGQAGMDLMNQAQYLNLGLDVKADRLDVSLAARGKAGSAMDKALQRAPVGTLDLASFLNKNSIMRMQLSFSNLHELMDLYMKYMTVALGPEQQATLAKMKEVFNGLDKVGKVQYALSFGMSPEGKVQEEVVMVSDDNDALMDLMCKKMGGWINSGPFHDIEKNMGLEMNMTEDPATRKVEGADVHHFTMTVKVTSGAPADQKALLEKLLGNMSFEISKMGHYVVATANEPIDTLAGRVGGKQPGTPLQATRTYQPGGVFYADLSLPALLGLAKAVLPQEMAAGMPNFAPGAPPIVMAGYLTDGLAYFQLSVFKELITSISATQGGAPGAIPSPATTMR